MSYTALRHFADSYGLGVMILAYLVLVLWGFRPGSRPHNDRAANMIFAPDANAISDRHGDPAATREGQDHG